MNLDCIYPLSNSTGQRPSSRDGGGDPKCDRVSMEGRVGDGKVGWAAGRQWGAWREGNGSNWQTRTPQTTRIEVRKKRNQFSTLRQASRAVIEDGEWGVVGSERVES
jgi:hypothetical protein